MSTREGPPLPSSSRTTTTTTAADTTTTTASSAATTTTRCDPLKEGSHHEMQDFVIMSPPIVDWAPMDLFYNYDDDNADRNGALQDESIHHNDELLVQKSKMLIRYHALTAGHQVLAPIGATAGFLAHYLLTRPLTTMSTTIDQATSFSSSSTSTSKCLQLMGTAAVIAGGIGSLQGLYRLSQVSRQPTAAGGITTSSESVTAPSSWTDDAIIHRADALRTNFPVRVMDLSTGAFATLAVGVLVAKGGPSRVGFSPGIWGTMQAVGLGVSVGSASAVACVLANRQR